MHAIWSATASQVGALTMTCLVYRASTGIADSSCEAFAWKSPVSLPVAAEWRLHCHAHFAK
eukprot:9102559-Pyramimonas_sp.AAC.1